MPNVCVKTDQDTSGNTSWTPSALTKFTISGIPVALMGDTGGSATITQGSVKILVGGKPVAYMGCTTSAGTMISTQTKVIVSI
jgi:uncharacterized Zn-binding protein involved in type VI secretion